MKRIFVILCFALFGCIILLLAILAFYNVPNAETIELSAIPQITSWGEYYWWFYDFVQGRYVTGLLHYMHPLAHQNMGFMWTVPIFSMCILFFSFYMLLKALLSSFFEKTFLIITAWVLIAFVIVTAFSIAELMFLLNAVLVYLLFASVVLWIWTALVYAYRTPSFNKKSWWLLLTAILLFLSGGGGEVFFPVTVLTAFIAAALFRKVVLASLALPFSTIAGIVIAYSSPGNLLDLDVAKGYEFTFSFFKAFSIRFLKEYLSILYAWANLQLLLLTLFLIVGSWLFLKKRHFTVSAVSWLKWGAGSFLIALLMPALVYFPFSFIVYTEGLAPRVVDASLLLFVIWWCLFSIFSGGWLSQRINLKYLNERNMEGMAILLCIVTFVAFISTTNIQQAYSDWSKGIAQQHHREFIKRVKLFKEIPAEQRCKAVVTVPPYTVWPKSIHLYVDLYGGDASASWYKAYEAYFGVKEVRSLNEKEVDVNKPSYRFWELQE